MPLSTSAAPRQLSDGNSQGTVLGQSAADPIGFFGTTPVVQPASTGATGTVAAGATTNVFTNTTFSGGIGTTAYTVTDVVKALKQLGLLAA